jgi:hypothetical protein
MQSIQELNQQKYDDVELYEQNLFEQYIEKLNSHRDNSTKIIEVIKMGAKNPYDVLFKTANGQTYIVELKHRYVSTYNVYDEDGGLILESKKFNKVMKSAIDLNAIPLYVNSFNDLSILIFELNQIDFNQKELIRRKFPKKTLEKTEWIDKDVYFLLSSEGTLSTLMMN